MSEFHAGLADIFEVSEAEITPAFDLAAHTWDSLAIVSTLALIDEVFNVMVDGKVLAACATVADLDAVVAATVAQAA